MKRSESITELAKSLVKFNSKVTKIAKDAKNPFFKNDYTTLDQIISEVRPILSEVGLSVMQIPGGDGTNVIMTTLLVHESGEWLESEPLIMKPVKNDPQAVGSCITYARRYSLQSFLSLNTGEDDDGNGATHGNQKPQTNNNQQQSKPTGQQTPPTPQAISEPQKKKINVLVAQAVEKFQSSKEHVYASLYKKEGIGQFKSITELTKGQASRVIAELDKVLGGTE